MSAFFLRPFVYLLVCRSLVLFVCMSVTLPSLRLSLCSSHFRKCLRKRAAAKMQAGTVRPVGPAARPLPSTQDPAEVWDAPWTDPRVATLCVSWHCFGRQRSGDHRSVRLGRTLAAPVLDAFQAITPPKKFVSGVCLSACLRERFELLAMVCLWMIG